MDLSDTQHRLLAYLREHIARHGYPPSQMEIARAFGFRQNRSARHHLEVLAQAGLIELATGRARGIRLTGPDTAGTPGDGLLQVPLLGRVAAGQPIGSDPEVRRELTLDPSLFRLRPDYLLEVEGDSMILDAILPGDLIGVHRTPQARHGQTVVARIEGELTVKRLDTGGAEGNGGHLRLLPRNPAYAPIEIDARIVDFAIEGLFAGLVRPG
ncbi:transcriptional repressor LexA [Lysobacter sp. H23M47]|uniref:transcriptional repressor LexA n=1 Tax=Lysobacter sp. H23M47 TaxID=2781024 RepID=UPI00187E7B3A|nr:transcriptional repressor LexA [Lysobacter sp. H23M47]QOW25559.1 transcriptional repressor LexA [Lysobacter sp. H23M47]